jgi:hypothetical protein
MAAVTPLKRYQLASKRAVDSYERTPAAMEGQESASGRPFEAYLFVTVGGEQGANDQSQRCPSLFGPT